MKRFLPFLCVCLMLALTFSAHATADEDAFSEIEIVEGRPSSLSSSSSSSGWMEEEFEDRRRTPREMWRGMTWYERGFVMIIAGGLLGEIIFSIVSISSAL